MTELTPISAADSRDALRARIEAAERRNADRTIADQAREAATAAVDYTRANPLTVILEDGVNIDTIARAVFVDGVRIDSQSTGGAPWESIPLGLIDRIEVLRGAASAVYGSDAMSGVIQIFTPLQHL